MLYSGLDYHQFTCSSHSSSFTFPSIWSQYWSRSNIIIFCCFRIYGAHSTALLLCLYLVLAYIDRWAISSTSVRRRAFRQIKVAKILIPSVAIIWCIISIHIAIQYSLIVGKNTITYMTVVYRRMEWILIIQLLFNHFLHISYRN